MSSSLGKWGYVFVAALLCPIFPLHAQEEAGDPAESEIEIDLEALDALRPDREAPEAEMPGQPGEPTEVLAPPSLETEKTKGPPPLTPPVELEETGAQPQSPAAPRMIDQAPMSRTATPAISPIGTSFTILFEEDSTDLSIIAAETLDKIARLSIPATARIQLFGFAGTLDDSPSTTRRLALRRTVAIRGYLMNQGVEGTRIDLRPQGPRAEDGPKEAVVIEFLEKGEK